MAKSYTVSGSLVVLGMFLSLIVMLLVQSLPFPITPIEQFVLYMFAIVILFSGILMMAFGK
jgi:hypothetical protein